MSRTDTLCASKTNGPEQVRQARRVTLWGLAGNLMLSALKFVFGILGASQALVADAVHSLSDSTTDVAILIGAPIWSAPADADHPFGHGRIETMITVFIGIVLGGVAIGIGYHAVATIGESHTVPPGWVVFYVACISIVAKEMLYRWTVAVGKRIHSTALVANAWHHRSDGFSSIPVAVAVLGTKIRPEWVYLDHIAALLVSLLILQAAARICWPALKQLADTGASREERNRIRSLALSTKGVKGIHAIRTRHIGNGLEVNLHIQVEPTLTVLEGHNIAGAVKHAILEDGPDVVDVLIHVEPG